MAKPLQQRQAVPWDSPGEIALWAVALIIATFFIYNFVRLGKEHVLHQA